MGPFFKRRGPELQNLWNRYDTGRILFAYREFELSIIIVSKKNNAT
jgi:hypothetical protein